MVPKLIFNQNETERIHFFLQICSYIDNNLWCKQILELFKDGSDCPNIHFSLKSVTALILNYVILYVVKFKCIIYINVYNEKCIVKN